MRRVRVVLLLAAIVVLGGCSFSDRGTVEAKAPAGGLLLKGAGATFPSLLYRRWFTIYQGSHRGAVIAYDAVGSGEGIRRFTGANIKPEERVDFGASDAAMSDEQMARVPAGVVLLPVTAGSVVLAYNLPGFEGELRRQSGQTHHACGAIPCLAQPSLRHELSTPASCGRRRARWARRRGASPRRSAPDTP